MIIRKGFVGNSSSSSYIVTIHGVTKERFLRERRQELYRDGDVQSYIDEKESWLQDDRYANTLDLSQEERDELFSVVPHSNKEYMSRWWFEEAQKDINNAELVKEYAKEHLNNEITELILSDKYDISVNEISSGVEVWGHTPMHNSFMDMPDIFKEILGYYLNRGEDVTVRKE
jgi:hypothetical protein